MVRTHLFTKIVGLALMALFCFSASAMAAGSGRDDVSGPGIDLAYKPSLLLAKNEALSSGRHSEGDEDTHRLEKAHKYLGYATLLLAAATAVSSAEEDLHEAAAVLTAAGALSTVLTGTLAHGERLDLKQGWLTKDHRHLALGTLGAALLTTAVVIADNGKESSHSSLGVTGGLLMALAVVDIRW